MAEIKVFAMNDCDWMAGESFESVTAEYVKNYGGDERDGNEPRELTDVEMDGMRFQDTDDDGSHIGDYQTFRQRLNKLIHDGQQFPCFFASTEY